MRHNYGYDYGYMSQPRDLPPGFESMFVIVIVFALIIGVLNIIAFWKLFKKAGEKGWAVLIPIYNFIVMLRIAGKPTWWVILLFIPFVNLIVLIITTIYFIKAFGKTKSASIVFAIFFPMFYFPIIAFSKKLEYIGQTA